MIKDKLLRVIAIPLLGIFASMGAGLVSFSKHNFVTVISSLLYFLVATHLCWQGCLLISAYVRSKERLPKAVHVKLLVNLFLVASFAFLFFFVAAYGWQTIYFTEQTYLPSVKFPAIGTVAMLFVTLVYEILFLHAEVDVDEKVIKQLDYERLQAEAKTLQNDLDPHFLFNCLNTLSYLVKNEPEKAYLFVHKLSNVFKYLLINKQKDFISLAEEVAFLEDYYFLLQVRFDDAIRITKTIEASQTDCVLPPCTLQALVENAIKNNFFSEKEPLVISIQVNNYFITVSNTVRPKQYRSTAGDAGLSKLKTRYRHLMNEDVLVQETAGHFLVKVPFLQKAQVA